jgi:hypothetical protein
MEEMRWFSSAMLDVLAVIVIKLGFGLALQLKSAKLLTCFCYKITWHVQDQPHRAIWTLQFHHLLDPYGGNEMVQQCYYACGVGVLAVNKLGFGLALAEIFQTLDMLLRQDHMASPKSATSSLGPHEGLLYPCATSALV